MKGRAGEARRTVYLEWCAPEDAAPDDVGAWGFSNPGIGHRIDPAFVASEIDSLEPRDFERERLGRWDEEVGGQWISTELWDACVAEDPQEDLQNVLGLAGGPSGDSAALVSATVADKPHLRVEGFWERAPSTSWPSRRPSVSPAGVTRSSASAPTPPGGPAA